MPLLDINHLRFSYQRRHTVLQDLSLSVERGDIVGLVGPNGSGKSTLIKLCFDLLEPGAGSITIAGHPNTTAHARQASMYLPSDDYLPEFLTGAEYLRTIFSLYREAGPDAGTVAEQFDELGMRGRQNSLIEDYSHGMRKKLQVMSALMLERPLTVIDETLNGVDLDAQRVIIRKLLELRASGSTIILCTHDFSTLEELASEVWVLDRGRLVSTVDVARTRADGERLRDVVDEVLFGGGR